MIFSGIKRRISVLIFRIVYRNSFRHFGKGVSIIDPLKIRGMSNISIHDNVNVEYKTWLSAVPASSVAECLLEIGQGTLIGHFNHIYATRSIIIGKKVLTADKVYIADNLHTYTDINVPVMDQGIKQIGGVEIGDGSWIGENACIMGVKIGRNCVVGANSVVTKDVPDYSVVAGAPAKIIKRFNLNTGEWEKVQ